MNQVEFLPLSFLSVCFFLYIATMILNVFLFNTFNTKNDPLTYQDNFLKKATTFSYVFHFFKSTFKTTIVVVLVLVLVFLNNANLVSFCQETQETSNMIILNFRAVLCIEVWFVIFNLLCIYSILTVFFSKHDFVNIHLVLVFLLFTLLLAMFSNEILAYINGIFPYINFKTSIIDPEYVYCTAITVFVIMFYNALLKKVVAYEILKQQEIVYTFIIFFLLVNTLFFFKESILINFNTIKHMLSIIEIEYILYIYFSLKILFLVYLLITVFLFLKDKDYVLFLKTIVNKGTFLSLVTIIALASVVANDSLYSKMYFVEISMKVVLILLVILSLYHVSNSKIFSVCEHKEFHLQELKNEKFSYLIEQIDNQIIKKVPDKIMLSIFRTLKTYEIETNILLVFMPSMLIYFFPLFFLYKKKALIISIFVFIGNLPTLLLKFPTTKRYLFTVGLMCCGNVNWLIHKLSNQNSVLRRSGVYIGQSAKEAVVQALSPEAQEEGKTSESKPEQKGGKQEQSSNKNNYSEERNSKQEHSSNKNNSSQDTNSQQAQEEYYRRLGLYIGGLAATGTFIAAVTPAVKAWVDASMGVLLTISEFRTELTKSYLAKCEAVRSNPVLSPEAKDSQIGAICVKYIKTLEELEDAQGRGEIYVMKPKPSVTVPVTEKMVRDFEKFFKDFE